MFRELKEYQDIIKLYQNNVYQSEEDIIKEAFASEEFTKEEAAFIEENFDALIEEVIAEEEESLSEQITGRQRGKALRQKANEIISDIRKPAAKTTKVSSKAIQGGGAGVVGKFKSALSKVGSKIGNVAKTTVKTGAAPFKAGGAVSKMGAAAGKSGLAVKGAKVLSKLGPAGKIAAGAALAGGALLANRKNIKAAADKAKGEKITKQVDKYVEKNKGDKPIRKIDPAPFNKKEKADPPKQQATQEPEAKPLTKKQKFDAKFIKKDKGAGFVKRGTPGAQRAEKKEAAKLRAQEMARERIAKKKAAQTKTSAPTQASTPTQSKPVEKPAATPSGDKLKSGSFGISKKGKEQAAMNKGEAAAKKTNIPSGDKLKAGSFGISKKGKDQAAANKAEVAKKKESNTVPSGSFGISEKGKKQAEANKKEVAMRPTNTGNARRDNFNKKINTLKNKKKYGGTGNPITIGDKTFKPGDKGYKDAFNTVSSAVSKSMQKNSYEPDIDAYDLVLEYLISTEQVATIEEANYVMIEMDSETIQAIVEEQKKNIDEGLLKAAGITALALPAVAAVAKKFLKPKSDKAIDKGRKTLPFGGDKRSGVTEEGVFADPKLNKKYPNQPKMTEKGKAILPNLPDPKGLGSKKTKKQPRVFGDPTGEMTKDFFK
tara:strand:- start:43 stop:2013 length:1971 start_codon:yes stop_codon:yes gene_type:complete